MINVLLISSDEDFFNDLASTSNIKKNIGLKILRAKSGSDAFSIISVNNFELVITDELLSDMTGLEFVEKLLTKNPMINCAAVSSLSSKNFHTASEGLGIFMQLPPKPDKTSAKNLLQQLNNILKITNRTNLL